MKTAKSFCRSCGAMCGTTLTLSDNDQLISVTADNDNPLSNGYICYKGLYAAEMNNHPERLLHTVKRMPNGDYQRIDTEQALDEIADKMRDIIEQHGKDAIATYTGSHTYLTATAWIMLPMFRDALGTQSYYSTATIDQSSKFVTAERLGVWGAGKQPIHNSDVILLIGTNPLVAHATAGCLTADPVKTLKKERARGLKVIVIDPRRSESAAMSDLFLQPWPGQDAAIAAGLIRLILANDWHDQDFVSAHVEAEQLAALQTAVEPFTPEKVASTAGISADELYEAARLFATANRGSAFSGTGPAMSPQCNLSEHLIETLNVICGRYRRAGEHIHDVAVLLPPRPAFAQAFSPQRQFEASAPSRIRGAGSIWGEKMTSTLPDEILTPGAGQVRCLINAGGNPASTFPDQHKTVKALKSLDLLVSIQPFLSTTARLADYVFAPKLQYERADIPMYIFDMSFYSQNWAQYTGEIVKPPAGSQLVDDWYVFWGIAKRLDLQLNFQGTDINMDTAPSTDGLLDIRCQGSVVPLEEVRKHPSGKVFDLDYTVQEPFDDSGRFEVMPKDVQQELSTVAASIETPRDRREFTHLLQARRIRESNNSSAVMLDAVHKRIPDNWAAMHPEDINQLKLALNSTVTIRSEHGSIQARVRADDSIRPGVISVSHGWGGLPGENNQEPGSNVNQLISSEAHIEPINAMVRMSAIPVQISAA